MSSSEEIIFYEKLQELIARQYKSKPPSSDIKIFCGLDVAYKANKSVVAAVLWDVEKREVIEHKLLESTISSPYIPNFFFIREAPLLLKIIDHVSLTPDILLVDGHGLAHPRKAGLAVFIGVLSGLPTIGFAKSLLVGEVEDSIGLFRRIMLNKSCVGYYVQPNESKGFYASPGNRINIKNVKRIIQLLGPSYPIPLKEADSLVKQWSRKHW